jgi:hypothetical protein
MDEELCSSDGVLWCSPALDEPPVLSSSTTGSTSTAPPDVARGATPYLGGYDDDAEPSYVVPPALAIPGDGIPPMLRRYDEPTPAPAPTRPRVSASERAAREEREREEENREGMERVEHISEGLEVIAEGSELVHGHEIPVVGAASELLGAGAGLSHTVHGALATADGHSEGVPEMISGVADIAGNGTALGLRAVGAHGSVVPDLIEDVGDTVAGGVSMVDAGIEIEDGDTAHGVPHLADATVDTGLALAGTGLLGAEGTAIAHGPAGVVIGGAATLAREGRVINEADQTFGTTELEDGTERGINSYEFAVANGTDAYGGIHDYLAGDAEEGSAREIAAEVGGVAAGGLVGLGAGIVGLGGDLVAGARARSTTFDNAWSWMTE